jgi:hypothetical protein
MDGGRHGGLFHVRKFLLGSVARAATRLAALTCLAVFASAGVAAAAPCPTLSSVTPFAQWGDSSSYFLAPGGSFEGPASSLGWTLDSAGVAAANEPFDVGVGSNAQSLTIGAGGSATSAALCLDKTMPYFQFFARQLTPGSDLRVQLTIGHGNRHAWAITVADLPDGSMPNWAPTGRMFLVSGRLPAGLSFNAALRFAVPAAAGSWQIDDVYVDPYRSS